MLIAAATLDDLLRKAFRAVLDNGAPVEASRGPNSELCGVLLKLSNPRARLSQTETKGKVFSALGELAWYLSASDRADFISYYISHYANEEEVDGSVRGAYGPRLFTAAWHNQFESVAALLKRKPNTRQAVIQLFDNSDLAGMYKDIPCTCTLQFMVRDAKLNLTVTMRSNDVYKGLPHDVFSFTMLQEIMAVMLQLPLGDYTHFAASLHLYDKQKAQAKLLIDEGVLGTKAASMPQIPDTDKTLWKSIKAFRRAEVAIRSGREPEPEAEPLHDYWQDLIRLLRVFRHSKTDNFDAIAAIRGQMVSPYYAEYIVAREGA
ncbi:MAG: thymidylate synthase [Gemmataceae bacterium]